MGRAWACHRKGCGQAYARTPACHMAKAKVKKQEARSRPVAARRADCLIVCWHRRAGSALRHLCSVEGNFTSRNRAGVEGHGDHIRESRLKGSLPLPVPPRACSAESGHDAVIPPVQQRSAEMGPAERRLRCVGCRHRPTGRPFADHPSSMGRWSLQGSKIATGEASCVTNAVGGAVTRPDSVSVAPPRPTTAFLVWQALAGPGRLGQAWAGFLQSFAGSGRRLGKQEGAGALRRLRAACSWRPHCLGNNIKAGATAPQEQCQAPAGEPRSSV